jgi:hypothetical protein
MKKRIKNLRKDKVLRRARLILGVIIPLCNGQGSTTFEKKVNNVSLQLSMPEANKIQI